MPSAKLRSLSRLRAIMALGVLSIAAVRAQSDTQTVQTPGRTTVDDEASIKDPNKECQPYYYEPIGKALASFPPIWDTANILPEDGNAQAKFASIKDSIPDIPPKGTPDGNFDGLNYPADDPHCWWTNSKCGTPKAPGVPADISIMPEPRTLGYGFDDGPNCSHNAFYDYLASQKQTATMFYIGSNVMDWPLEAARAVKDGHEICVHSWSHHYMTALSNEVAFAELYYSLQAVKIATGVTPTCWRPPFGDVDDRIRAIAAGLGLRTILWAYDSQDWQVGVTPGITSDAVDKEYQTMVDDAKKGMFDNVGTMILAHELDDFTMNEAMKFYPILREVFDHIVPVAVGMNITQPYVESEIAMLDFAKYISLGKQLIANSTNSSATNQTATMTRSVVGSQPSTTPQVNNEGSSKQTADASRLSWALSGSGGIKFIVAFLLGFLCAARVGVMPN